MFSRLLLYLGIALSAAAVAVPAHASPVRNVVLVHGAFAGGSGWRPVYDMLTRKGYHVSIVQQPLTSFTDDVAATKRILAMQVGPCVLVAHSYGGAIITEAGNDPKVSALVYIAAHALDTGETEVGNGKRFPPAYKSLQKTPDGFTYIDPARFPEDFAADLPRPEAEFEAHSQMLTAAQVFAAQASQLGRQSRAGTWSPRPIASSIRILKECMLSALEAGRWKSRARAIPYTSRDRPKSPR